MTQTASFKSKLKDGFSIFKWELKNCSGALTVYAILATVFTAITLTLSLAFGYAIAAEGDNFNYDAVLGAVTVFQVVATYAVYYINAVFTIVYTIRIYSYLHNKRKADMYGAMPVSRRTFYLSKTISAFLFSVVPTLFFFGIIAIISVCFGQMLIVETTRVYVQLLLGSIASISFYGLLAVCCGTTLNSVLSFVAVNFAYPVTALFIKGTIKAFFYGLPTNRYNNSFIMKALNPLAAYDGQNVIYWILFTAACLALGTFLVKKRKAECAQTSFAYYLPCYIVKLLIAFIIGMFLGVLFGSINVFNNGYAGFVFGFILGSIPAYIISHLILYKGFSKLLKTSVPLAGLVVTVAALMAVCHFDVFGYNSYIPSVDNIQSAGLVDLSDCYYTGRVSTAKLAKMASDDYADSENIETITKFHKNLVNHYSSAENKYVQIWANLVLSNIPSELYNDGYCVSYKLNNGRIVSRLYDSVDNYLFYDSYFDRSGICQITDSNEYYINYDPVMNAKAEDIRSIDIISKTKSSSDDNSDKYAVLSSVTESGSKKLNADKALIMEALRKDIAEKGDESRQKETAFDFYISFNKSEYKDGLFSSLLLSDLYAYDTTDATVYVYSDYTNTIEALKKAGIINSDNTINEKSKYFSDHKTYYNNFYDY